MLTIALAVAAACGWGLADFLAGQASRATSTLLVLCLTQALGLVLVLPVAAVAGAGPPASRYLFFAVVSGLTLSLALGALYRGMVVGLVGLVSTIAATGTVVAVFVGLLQGNRPSAVQGFGVLLAIGGVVLVSWRRSSTTEGAEKHGSRLSASVRWGLIAAAAGGLTQVAIQQGARGGVLWMLVAQRATVTAVAGLVARRFGTMTRPPPPVVPTLLMIGIADVVATGFFAASTRHGELALAAATSSLYPVVTVALAVAVLHERLTPMQLGGVIAALAGTAAIASGVA
jgi:drug/metabolite transporter (DMT)-like permease